MTEERIYGGGKENGKNVIVEMGVSGKGDEKERIEKGKVVVV